MAKDQPTTPGAPADNFVAHAREVFARELLQPMCQRVGGAPSDVRALIGEFRQQLEELDVVVGRILGANQGADEAQPHPALQAALLSPVDPDQPLNGAGSTPVSGMEEDADGSDDIGRNQRSRLRELTLLDHLSRDTNAYSLQQVLRALQSKGFDGGSSAVVSQLHRLKKIGVIHQPANGMYQITTEGLSHLHQLRASFGSLLDNSRG